MVLCYGSTDCFSSNNHYFNKMLAILFFDICMYVCMFVCIRTIYIFRYLVRTIAANIIQMEIKFVGDKPNIHVNYNPGSNCMFLFHNDVFL